MSGVLEAILGGAWIGPAIVAALISSGVTALGWQVSHRRETAAERRRRLERVVDLQKALRAEIRAHAHQLEHSHLDDHLPAMVARMRESPEDAPFSPFVPLESHDTVFRALVSEVHVLPTETVDPVVLYYNQVIAIRHLAEDLRSERYRALEVERRIAIYTHFIEMKRLALELSSAAIAALDDHIAEIEALSSPAAGRSAR